jgi:hypothetical protein
MTDAERLLALHLKELGCIFESQYLYAKGRKLRADFAVWTYAHVYPNDKGLLVEIVGGIYGKGRPCKLCGRRDRGAHGSITGVKKDNDRLNAATLNGWFMMRFTPQQVESGEAKAMLEEALKR